MWKLYTSMLHARYVSQPRVQMAYWIWSTVFYVWVSFRSNSHLTSAIPPLRVGQLNSHHLLSELSTREKNLRKMMEGKNKLQWVNKDEGENVFSISNRFWDIIRMNYYIFLPHHILRTFQWGSHSWDSPVSKRLCWLPHGNKFRFTEEEIWLGFPWE